MISVDSEKRKISVSNKSQENFLDFSILVGVLCDLENIKEVKRWFEIAVECYEEQGSVLNNKNKPSIETYEIKAKNKKQAIKQVKALELPKHVEKVVLEQLKKDQFIIYIYKG